MPAAATPITIPIVTGDVEVAARVEQNSAQ
jgi:hypothetical protein